MPTVIDSLIVTLGLDPADYVQGSQAARTELQKTGEQATKTSKDVQLNLGRTSEASEKLAKDLEARGKSAAEFFGKIRDSAIGMFAVFTAGRGIKDFVEDTTSADAATGRLAKNLGMSAQVLSQWQQVMATVGGTADDANSSFMGLQNTIFSGFKMGDIGSLQALHALGVTDPNAPLSADLTQISKFMSTHSGAEDLKLGHMAGLTDAMINFLEQGPAGVQKALAADKKNALTPADVAAAQARQKAWAQLEQTLERVGRTIETQLTPFLLKLEAAGQKFADWAEKNPMDALAVSILGFGAGVKGAQLALGAFTRYLLGDFIAAIAGAKAAGVVAPAELAAGEAVGAAGIGAAGIAGIAAVVVGVLGYLGWTNVIGPNAKYNPVKGLDPSTQQSVATGEPAAGPLPAGTGPWGKLPSAIQGVRKWFSSIGSGGGGNNAANLKQTQDYFLSQGWTPAQVAGLTANAFAESGFDPTKVGDSGTSRGLLQWHNDRARQMFDWTTAHGYDPNSLKGQLAFAQWDLTQGPNKAAGDALRQQTDPTQAGMVVSRLYERPAGGEAEAYRRGQTAPMFVPNLPAQPVGMGASARSAVPVISADTLAQLRASAAPRAVQPLGMGASARTAMVTNHHHGPVNSHNSQSTENHVSVTVHAKAADASGVAKSISESMKKHGFLTLQANTGLA